MRGASLLRLESPRRDAVERGGPAGMERVTQSREECSRVGRLRQRIHPVDLRCARNDGKMSDAGHG
jgi:hypothetical protein